jgi:hypothetical protein
MQNRFRFSILLTLCLVSGLSHRSWAATPGLPTIEMVGDGSSSEERFHFIFPTKHRHWESTRADEAKVEVREMPLGKLGEALKRAQEIIPRFRKWGRRPVVTAYIASTRTPEQIAAFVETAKKEFAKFNDQVRPRIVVKIRPPQAPSVSAMALSVEQEANRALAENPRAISPAMRGASEI